MFLGGPANFGSLYSLTTNGVYSTLHEFVGGSDGGRPYTPPIQGKDGSFYGATTGAGSGTIYKYSSTKGFETIYEPDAAHGSFVVSVTQASDGTLYGSAASGGAFGCGTVFQITTSGSLLWYYSFPCGRGGFQPIASSQASDGNFYGVTAGGALANGSDAAVFTVDSQHNVKVLYNFGASRTDGMSPQAGVTEGTDGNLYGTTEFGGKFNQGTLYQVSKTGTYRQLYGFSDKVGGKQPVGSLLQDTNGTFYGTASLGGKNSIGTVYSLDMSLARFAALLVYEGKIASSAQILGQGFTGTKSVTFNGVPATSFSVVSDTYMTAVVPAGATTGNVVVTTPTGTLTSNKPFTVNQ